MIEQRHPISQGTSRISLVGAGPGAADLLTLRAIRCLQQADAVFYDRLVEPEVLDLARPDAQMVYVGKDVGAHHWPQEDINAAILDAAGKGLHAVRLKSGDPSVFGRADEELSAARAAGIPVEIIPGITAASACAALLQEPLTCRGETDRVILATGTCRQDADGPSFAEMLQPGTSLALYMAAGQAKRLQTELLQAGLPPDHEIRIAASAEKPGQKTLLTTLSRLTADMETAGIGAPAVLMVKRSKHGSAAPAATHAAPAAAPIRARQPAVSA